MKPGLTNELRGVYGTTEGTEDTEGRCEIVALPSHGATPFVETQELRRSSRVSENGFTHAE